MTRKAVQFLRGFGAYNKDETACFDQDRAGELIAQKVAVEAKDQPSAGDMITVSLGIDPRDTEAFKEASAEIARAAQEVQDRDADLDRREADLAARAMALDEREAALADRENAVAEAETASKTADDTVADRDVGAVRVKQPEPAGKAVGLPKQGR